MVVGPDRPAAVTRPAPAKINLALHVTARRSDGYHDLDTFAVFTDLHDRVTVAGANGPGLRVEGPFASCVPHDKSNLAMAAARIFFSTEGIEDKVLVSLQKNIPVGAGLGGGSADAAAIFHALNQYFKTGLDDRRLAELGAALGADIPMCIYCRALRARGIGDAIEPVLNIPPLPLVLAWPGRGMPTASVFARLKNVSNDPLPDLPASLPTVEAVADYLAPTRNDLQAAAMAMEPAIADTIEALAATDGCLIARMSGSGSACFGLYASADDAAAAAQLIGAARRNWWVRATRAG